MVTSAVGSYLMGRLVNAPQAVHGVDSSQSTAEQGPGRHRPRLLHTTRSALCGVNLVSQCEPWRCEIWAGQDCGHLSTSTESPKRHLQGTRRLAGANGFCPVSEGPAADCMWFSCIRTTRRAHPSQGWRGRRSLLVGDFTCSRRQISSCCDSPAGEGFDGSSWPCKRRSAL